MKDIFKKIIISLSAFLLVLSFSFGHLNTSKRFEVQASEYSITTQVAAVIAVLMAAAGIQLVNEPTLDQMQDIYDSLSVEAQGVLSSPTLGNNIVEGMIALPYAQAQTALHSLINTFEAWDWTGTKAYSNGTLADSYLPKLVFGSTVNTSDGWATTIVRNIYSYNSYPYWAEKLIKNNTLTLGTLYTNGVFVGSTKESFTLEVKFGVYLGSEFLASQQAGLTLTNYYIGSKFTCTSSGTHCNQFNGNVYKPYNQSTGQFNIIGVTAEEAQAYLSLMIGAAGLTLPAPTTGWDNSQPGDVDLDGWTKGLTIPDVGDVVVLGGLAAGTLAGLSHEAVLVPSESQTPFDPSEDPDYGDEDPYNPPPATSSAWYTAWLAAIAGATAGMFDFNPLADALAAIQDTIMSIVQPLIDGMTAAFNTMLQALFQPFLSAFSELFTWDIDASKIKIDGIRAAIFARIPCVEETLEAWYSIMAVNGSNMISSFTFFGETFSISSGDLLEAFRAFGNMIQQAFRFVFWFIFLKGMRRRVTSFLGLVSAER